MGYKTDINLIEQLTFKPTKIELERNPGSKNMCIPACYICCLTGEEGVVLVYDGEKEGLERLGYTFVPVSVKKEEVKLHLSRRLARELESKVHWALKSTPGVPLSAQSLSDTGIIAVVNKKTDGTCPQLVNNKEGSQQITKEQWSGLVDFYRKTYELGINPQWPGSYEGLICGKYGEGRPRRCSEQGCNYSYDLLPSVGEKRGEEVLAYLVNKMFEEPSLRERLRLANSFSRSNNEIKRYLQQKRE